MTTRNENARNEQYIFKYKDNPIKEVITYRKNVIQGIQRDVNAANISAIQEFSAESVTDARLEAFAEIAREAGYTIYKVEEIQE